MPRKPQRPVKDEGIDLDAEAAAAAVETVQVDLKAEEAAAAFFAAEKREAGEKKGDGKASQESVGSILSESAGETLGESADPVPTEAEADAGSAGSESPGSEEEEDEEAAAGTLTAAERRPTTMGGGTVLTS